MYKLEEANMISEYSKLVGKKRTRVYYHIEPLGQSFLRELMENYKHMTGGVELIFNSFAEEDKNVEKE